MFCMFFLGYCSSYSLGFFLTKTLNVKVGLVHLWGFVCEIRQELGVSWSSALMECRCELNVELAVS